MNQMKFAIVIKSRIMEDEKRRIKSGCPERWIESDEGSAHLRIGKKERKGRVMGRR